MCYNVKGECGKGSVFDGLMAVDCSVNTLLNS